LFILERFTEAKLQTAVSPSIFSFSTIHILFPFRVSSAVIFFAGFSISPSTFTISSSSNVSTLLSSYTTFTL